MMPQQVPRTSQASVDDSERHLRTDGLKTNLAARTARGGAVTIASQGLKFFIQMGATVVLARLLSPKDYGLIGMVVIVTGFISMFKDLGLSAATIQQDELNQEQISTLFWVNAGLSLASLLLTLAIAPLVALFYGEPRLTAITMVFAVGFIFGGLTVQHEALLRRQMRFAALALAEIVSLVLGITTAILLAWYGARYWALVCNQLVAGLVYATCVWVACGWRPSFSARYAGVRSMLLFGRNLTGFTIVNYFARNLDNMLIGRFWGSQELGLYAKAYQLLLLPLDQINTPITSVAVPALSRLADSPERYRQAYLRMLEKVAILTMPLMAYMIATSDLIVRLVLGPQWMASARIFALLGIAGLVQPVASTSGWLFLTQNRTHHMFQWGLIGGTITILFIVIGLPWGGVGVATSYSVGYLVIVVPLLFWFVGRQGPVQTADFYRVMIPIAGVSLCALAAVLGFRWWVQSMSPLVGLVICFIITVAVTLLLLSLVPRGRRMLQDFKFSLALLVERRKTVQ